MCNLRPKLNNKIVYCSLKNTSLGGNGARGDKKYKNSTAFLNKGKYLEKQDFLVNLSDLISKFIFSELKTLLEKPF